MGLNRKLKGLAVMLFSLILMTGFQNLKWIYFFDLDLQWQHIWLILGAVGFLIVIWDPKKKSLTKRSST